MIRTFRSRSLTDAEVKELPERLVVMPWGDNEINGGKILKVNATTLAQLPANQALVNFDRVALDFNHNSVPDTPFYKGEPVKVAAYASVKVVEGEGIVYDDIEWTKEGREMVEGGHYIDLSPAIKDNDAGEVIFLHSTALCRQGEVRGLSLHSADPFETENPNLTMKYKTNLIQLLGLKADATEEAIDASLKTFTADLEKLREEAGQVKALAAKIEAFEKKTKTPEEKGNSDLKALAARIDSLEKSADTRERDVLKAQAIRDGKIVPLSADKLDLEDFKALVAELPADQVPMDKRTPDGIKALASAGVGATDSSEAEVKRQLNISDDDWKKYNG
ncbi:phage protease [Cerasicoccus maritimus]|uniref:phage protease n=1 Tax=Cerasicoccus maritimus TaxID=490089 RepID=UPI00285281D3|nr:phage protease [Cerasicoccus maritimus]